MNLTELAARLAKPSTPGRTEADIQSDIQTLLLGYCHVDEAGLEEQIADGTRRRIDIAAGQTVIEVKKRLDGLDENADEIEQLRGYVETRQAGTTRRYNGVLTDGHHWWLFEPDPDTGCFDRRAVFTLTTGEDASWRLVEWLNAVLLQVQAVVPDEVSIMRYLGHTSPGYAQDRAFLTSILHQLDGDPTVGLKRDLWARMLRSALGDSDLIGSEALFVDHTLLVIEAAVIAHAVMGINLADLREDPALVLTGELFHDAGIHNAVEPGFFDWVLGSNDAERFLLQVIRRVGVFDWHACEHDVLKVLYESIISAATRKNLGEYYTPDWLAQAMVENAVTDPLSQRVLDPACGSGTFIFHTVRAVVAAGKAAGWGVARIVEHVQSHVFGLDIHPVSVVLARVTYLLALGDLLSSNRRDEVWVPVHLGDSMQWYQLPGHEGRTLKVQPTGRDLTTEDVAQHGLFDIGTVLAFPLRSVDDPDDFDRLIDALTNRAREHTDATSRKPDISKMLTAYGVRNQEDRTTLVETFELLCDLHAEGRDSIWGFFVRNQVRPLWFSMPGRQVDVLIGNPPWVAYRFMTADMQSQFKAFSQQRNLWAGGKVSTHQDLVALFIVRACEKYLAPLGRFAFVTPLAVLTRLQYEGFRAGDWGDRRYGQFTDLWDLKDVRPHLFPVPAAVVFGTQHTWVSEDKTQVKPRYGMEGLAKQVMAGKAAGTWKEAKAGLTVTETMNNPLVKDAISSPYGPSARQGATIVPRMLTFVEEEEARGKLGQARLKATVRSARSRLEKPPWRDVPDLTGTVERKFLREVFLGASVAPFRVLETSRAVLPIEGDTVLPEGEYGTRAEGFRAWFREAEAQWEAHRSPSTTSTLREWINYQGKLQSQLPTPGLRVAYTTSGNHLASTWIANRDAVIDNALYWLAMGTMAEARYLTAVLNAPVTTALVSQYQSIGLFGARHFHTYVWRLPIPLFDRDDPAHLHLARLAEHAETIAASVDVDGVGFQKARRRIRDTLAAEGIAGELDEAVIDLFEATQPGSTAEYTPG